MALEIGLEAASESDAFLTAFKAALRERCTVAAVATSKNLPNWENFAASGLPTGWTDVNNAVEAVRTLGTIFVDTSCEYQGDGDDLNTYAAGSYCNFPKSLEYRMRTDAEHDINADRIARLDTWDDDSLADYRRVLSNCAYWLNQMTVIAVPPQYARHYAQAVGNVYWRDWDDDAPHQEQDYPTSCVSAFPTARSGYPSIHLEWRETMDNTGGEDFPSTPTETGGYKSVNATYGCSILNPTPYQADCNLYFLHNEEAETDRKTPARQKRQHQRLNFSKFECGAYYSVGDDDEWPSEFITFNGNWGLVGNTIFHFETTATTAHTYTSAEDPVRYGEGKDGSGTEFGFISSINGDRSARAYYEEVDAKISYWRSWGDNEFTVDYFPILPIGGVAVGEPSFTQTIKAHTEKMLWTAPDTVWEPFNYFEGYSTYGVNFDRGAYLWSEDWQSTIDMRCIATLDFKDSFTVIST